MEIYAYDPKKGRDILAGIIRDGVFIKRCTRKHYMRIYDGYGIQETVINQLLKQNILKIRILVGNKKYDSMLGDWLAHGIRNKDHGHGLQAFLPIKRMTDEMAGKRYEINKVQETREEDSKEVKREDPGLFGSFDGK